MTKKEPLSIQGEQEEAANTAVWASEGETEAFVKNAQEERPEILTCKRRGRHNYVQSGLTFVGITKDGLWVRRSPCDDCHHPDEPVKVERVELWDVRHHRGKITKAFIVGAYPNYLDPNYLNTGGGRMKPRGIQAAEVTLELRGQGFRDFRKQILIAATEAARPIEVDDELESVVDAEVAAG